MTFYTALCFRSFSHHSFQHFAFINESALLQKLCLFGTYHFKCSTLTPLFNRVLVKCAKNFTLVLNLSVLPTLYDFATTLMEQLIPQGLGAELINIRQSQILPGVRCTLSPFFLAVFKKIIIRKCFFFRISDSLQLICKTNL